MGRFLEWHDPLLSHLGLKETDSARVNSLLDEATAAIEGYCGRAFSKTSTSEIKHSDQDGVVFLGNYPVTDIDRIYDKKATAIRITNDTAQVAVTTVTSTGIKFTQIVNGTKSSATALWADYTTLEDLAEALGSGDFPNWLGVISSTDFSSYPTSDLCHSIQSVKDLPEHTIWLDGSATGVDFERGLLSIARANSDCRIDYTAGYDPIPQDLIGVCADLVIEKLTGSLSLASESIGGYSYSRMITSDKIPVQSRQILDRYRRRV